MAQEKLIFAKPSVQGFCSIVVFEKDGRMYLDDAFFAGSAKELNSLIAENSSGVETIRYDCSVFMQDGKDLRSLVPDKSVFLFIPKGKLEERVLAQQEWLNKNLVIDPEYEASDYVRFMEMTEDYTISDKRDTLAADVLADAAKYFRRNILFQDVI
jgi:hypothetical protein